MEKKYTNFVGVDVSKLTLDACLLSGDEQSEHSVFANNPKGILHLLKWLTARDADPRQCLFCLEHTGIYALPLCCKLGESHCAFALVAAIEIKRSIGLRRGKSDKADSIAIARYAMLRQHTIRLYELPENKLLKLKLLLTQRQALVRHQLQFRSAATEYKGFVDETLMKEITAQNKSLMRQVINKIKQTNELIEELIAGDEQMKRIYDLLRSIPGIGPQTAAQLIACTRCFTAFNNSRQFACYAGIAPFEYTSGTSIKARTKVSPFANKQIKALLNLAALNAKKADPELRHYFERKLKEGKSKMLALNNVRNKLVARIFATINRGTPYVRIMNYAA